MQKLNEWLGIEFPFIQGGMANIATAERRGRHAPRGVPGEHPPLPLPHR